MKKVVYMNKYQYHIFSPYRVCPLGATCGSSAWTGDGYLFHRKTKSVIINS